MDGSVVNNSKQKAVCGQKNPRGLRFALGHQARVGKDTFANHLERTHGCEIFSIAEGVYDIATFIQRRLGKDVKKDPGLLQFIGNGLRDYYGKDVWIDPVIEKVQTVIQENPDANIVIPDMRYPNEMEKLGDSGFCSVKITRKDRPIDRDPNHISETALSNADFDFYFTNDGTIEEFQSKIDKFIANITGELESVETTDD